MRHMKTRLPRIALACCLCLLLSGTGCRDQNHTGTSIPARGVAQVGDTSISEEAFTRLMQQRAGRDPNRYTNAAEREALLEELIDREATYAKAKASGFDQRPEIQESIKRLIASRFLEEETAKQPGEPAVAESDLEQYYQEHHAKYAIPEKAHGAVIFLRVPATAAPEKRSELLAAAQKVLDDARMADDASAFALVVQNHSEDQATRYRAGDMGWVSRDARPWGMEPGVGEALFSLKKPGDFTPLVSTEKGIYIVKLIEKQPVTFRPFAEVKEEIRYVLMREKQDQREKNLYVALRSGLDIRINRPLLESIKPPAARAGQSPPAVPATEK